MALNFPNNPSINDVYHAPNGVTYQFSGIAWDVTEIPTGEPSLVDNALYGNVIPNANATNILGNLTHQWKDVTISNTIYLNNVPLTISNGNLLVNGNVQVGANLRNLTTNITTTANVSAGNISVTNKSSLTTLTVTGTAAFNGLTQIQQLDLPYTAKTAATGTITHDCSVGQTFYHTSISANFTPNFTNLGLVSGYVTEVKLYLVQGSSSRSVTAMQIDGVAKTINWYNAVAPTYSSNAVDIITFEILLVNTTYTVFGKVEKYDSVAGGGGG